MIRSKRSRLLALSAGAAMLATACTTGGDDDPETAEPAEGEETDEPAADLTAAIAMAGEPVTLDPHMSNDAPSYMMAQMMYDRLVRRDDGGTIVGNLASEWESTATSATFTLKDGVTCSDGTPLTASDVAASIERHADPELGAPSAGQVFGTGNTVTVTADDDGNTVKVELANPWSDLLMGLSLPQAGVICPAALADEELLASGGAGVGTGRYYVSDATPGSVYTVAARDGYEWAPAYASAAAQEGLVPTTVEMRVYADEATMANDLETGTLDYAGLTGADVARFVDADGFNMVPAPIVRMFIVFNEREGHPGADLEFRQAVAAALDREAANQAVTRGSGDIINSIGDPSVQCAIDDPSLLTPYDPEAASEVLDGMSFSVDGTSVVAGGAGTEYMQAVLNETGADVELNNTDLATWATNVLGNAGDWDITLVPNLNLTNLLTTPAALLTGPEPPDGRNFGAINNEEFDAGMAAATSAESDEDKCAAWAEAQTALLTNVDVIPLVASNVFYTTSERSTYLAPDGIYDPGSTRIIPE